MNASWMNSTRSHRELTRALPTVLYIVSGSIILLFGGPWYISAGGWDIYIGPILLTIAMLIVAVIYIKRASRIDLPPLNQVPVSPGVLWLRIAYYFTIVIAIRQLMLWKYSNPWEKLPMVFLVITHVTLIEGVCLRDVGLRDWTRQAFVLAVILACMDVVFSNTGVLFQAAVQGTTVEWYPASQVYWLSFPYQFLAVGFAEELFFRGWMYTRLRVHFSRRVSDKASFLLTLAVTSVLFGLFHVPWYVGNWFDGDFSLDVLGCMNRVISTGLMGVLFGYIYEKTGSIAAPSLVHGFGNSIRPLFVLGVSIMIYDPVVSFWSAWGNILFTIAVLPIFLILTRYLSKKLDVGKTLAWKDLADRTPPANS